MIPCIFIKRNELYVASSKGLPSTNSKIRRNAIIYMRFDSFHHLLDLTQPSKPTPHSPLDLP